MLNETIETAKCCLDLAAHKVAFKVHIWFISNWHSLKPSMSRTPVIIKRGKKKKAKEEVLQLPSVYIWTGNDKVLRALPGNNFLSPVGRSSVYSKR